MIFQHLKHQPRQCEHWWSPWIEEENMEITEESGLSSLFSFLFHYWVKKLGSMVVGDCSNHCTNTAHQHCANTAHQHWMPQRWHQMIYTLLEDLSWDYFTWHIALRSFRDHRRYKFFFHPNQSHFWFYVLWLQGAHTTTLIKLLHASLRTTRRVTR